MQLPHLAITFLSILDTAILVLLPFLDARLYRNREPGIVHSFFNRDYDELLNSSSMTVSSLQAVKGQVLESRVTMEVYAVEILESVIFRLQTRTGHKIAYDTRMLLPYKAKAMDYKYTSVRKILEEQLKGTPFSYCLTNSELKIVKKID